MIQHSVHVEHMAVQGSRLLFKSELFLSLKLYFQLLLWFVGVKTPKKSILTEIYEMIR